MNLETFKTILKSPSNIDASQLASLNEVINEYPYFQATRAIQLKALKEAGSFKYNNALKTTAAYTTDRSILFDFITSESFKQNKISEQIKQNLSYLKDIELNEFQDISVKKSVLIDDQLREQINESEAILDPALFQSKKEDELKDLLHIQSAKTEDSSTKPSPEAKLKLGQPLEFDKTEMHSFSEWLKITSFKPIVRSAQTTKPAKSATETTKTQANLIDQFLISNPKMPEVDKTLDTKNLAKERVLPPETLMTETLARIYLEQKNYKKAIQSYRILSLKYPEKSGFFADQIKAVRQLQQNLNSND